MLKPGWAILGGRFVLAVVPDYMGAEPDPDEDPCFVYREADAGITWDDGEPVLAFAAPLPL